MSKEETLANVELDLSLGHIHPALQRLASLTAAYPDDLEIRARRAEVNRRIGNPVEAGRWGYLTEEVDAAEIAAFERAFPRSWNQLLALKLKGDPTPELGPAARARFERLSERAGVELAAIKWTQEGPHPRRSGYLSNIGCLLLVVLSSLVFMALAVYGFLKLIGAI